MKKYIGYYIDGVYFNHKCEIDNFIKEQSIERYKMLVKMFANNSIMEISIACSDAADFLHNECGLSYEEIEQIEISVLESLNNQAEVCCISQQ